MRVRVRVIGEDEPVRESEQWKPAVKASSSSARTAIVSAAIQVKVRTWIASEHRWVAAGCRWVAASDCSLGLQVSASGLQWVAGGLQVGYTLGFQVSA